MSISRRALIGRLGAGAALVLPGLAEASAGAQHEMPVHDRPEERRQGVPGDRETGGPIRLHRNENVLGPSPHAIAAMRAAAESAVRYPDVAGAALQRKLADHHGVAVDRVMLGCGSSDLLRIAVDLFAGPGRTIVAALPTYEGLTGCAARAGARVIGVRLRGDHAHDVEAMLAHIDGSTGLVYICNPNNPTGSLTPRSDLETFVARVPPHVVVVIDEAYHEYVGEAAEYGSFINMPAPGARLIVTRSFSKAYGLAGLRVGYGILAPAIAEAVRSRQTADGVSALALRAAAAALDDAAHVRASVNRNADDRQEVLNQANARMLRSVDSLTNFVMLNSARPAADVIAHFAKHDILIAGPIAGYATSVRVSLGRPAEMKEFWRVWDLMPGGHMHG
jgi:histidinol-phosphate aminotransferase